MPSFDSDLREGPYQVQDLDSIPSPMPIIGFALSYNQSVNQSNKLHSWIYIPALLPHYPPCCRRVWEFFRNATIKLLSVMRDSCPTNHLVVKSLIALRPSDDIAATYMSRLAIFTFVPELLSKLSD